MRENRLADLSMTFAIRSLELANSVENHYSLKNQFERSSTSIGANIREANYAQSDADFLSKLQISLKECYETEYWLELFEKANIVEGVKIKALLHDCGEIRRLLVASIKTLKSKKTQ
jgi:four helix bundle protein